MVFSLFALYCHLSVIIPTYVCHCEIPDLVFHEGQQRGEGDHKVVAMFKSLIQLIRPVLLTLILEVIAE